MKKYKILDWYVHQGAQYELSKCDHDYFLVGADGKKPQWNSQHRPLRENVYLISEDEAKLLSFDIVIIRTPISRDRYRPFIQRGAAPVANIQTTDPISLPNEIKHIVWNSKDAMKNNFNFYKNRQQHFIVHGFDPDEFTNTHLDKNCNILTVANHFKKRRKIMGYDLWLNVSKKINNCVVVGSKNEDVEGYMPHSSSLNELVHTYNSYAMFFNPTLLSAMPRSRGEAAMCGMPIITTSNYDTKTFFTHNKNALIANDVDTIISYIKKMSASSQMRIDFGNAARENAINHFHIKDYLDKWNSVFEKAYNKR